MNLKVVGCDELLRGFSGLLRVEVLRYYKGSFLYIFFVARLSSFERMYTCDLSMDVAGLYMIISK